MLVNACAEVNKGRINGHRLHDAIVQSDRACMRLAAQYGAVMHMCSFAIRFVSQSWCSMLLHNIHYSAHVSMCKTTHTHTHSVLTRNNTRHDWTCTHYRKDSDRLVLAWCYAVACGWCFHNCFRQFWRNLLNQTKAQLVIPKNNTSKAKIVISHEYYERK